MTEIDREHPVPPVGEELHLPDPSLIPLLNAVGLTFAVVGSTISLVMVVFGTALFLGTTVRWIADTRREIDALPADHSH